MVGAAYNPMVDVEQILAAAKVADPATRFALMTTLDRYQTILSSLAALKKDIRTRGTVIPAPGKRKPSIPNPSLAEYNKLSASASSTVTALLRICVTAGMTKREIAPEEDEL